MASFSDDLLQALRDAGEHDRRSLTQEIVHLLETALGEPPKSSVRPDVEAQVTAWRKLAGQWESDDSTAEAERVRQSAGPDVRSIFEAARY